MRCKVRLAACLEQSYRRNQGSQQFSVVALTDSGGTIKERYAYTAYGTPTITDASGTTLNATAEGNRITYTGASGMTSLSSITTVLGCTIRSLGGF